MRIRPSILLFCAVILTLIVLLIWRKHSTTFSREVAPPKPTEANTPVAVTQSKNNSALTPAPISSANPALKSKAQQMLEGLSTLNDIPIVFYGKVLDQFNNPVANATVNFGVRVYNGHESTVKYGEITSDANGSFTISGYKGESLGVGVKKSGYAWVGMNGSGIYSKLYPEDQRAHPDPNNPVTIKMWKLQGAEPLMSINQHYKVHYTDTSINFDLLAGQIVPNGGDIQLTVNRAVGVISGRNRLAWSVQVAAVNGGVMGSSGLERVTYAAPESGYQPSMTFMFSTNPPDKWFGGFNQGFFMTSRNGKVYSKVKLSFNINDAPDGLMSVTFNGVANTNGSRNWEATAPQDP